MAKRFQITLAQLNPTVGDLEGNYKAALGAWQQAKKKGSDLIAFTELFITGYNTQDLIKKPSFCKAAQDKISKLAQTCAEDLRLQLVVRLAQKKSFSMPIIF